MKTLGYITCGALLALYFDFSDLVTDVTGLIGSVL